MVVFEKRDIEKIVSHTSVELTDKKVKLDNILGYYAPYNALYIFVVGYTNNQLVVTVQGHICTNTEIPY